MYILGITGPIQHGKSSLSQLLMEMEPYSQHLESFNLVAEATDRLLAQPTQPPQPGDLPGINNWLGVLPGILEDVVSIPKPEPIELKPDYAKTDPVAFEKLNAQLASFSARPELLGQKITDTNKPDFRPLLQWLGGYVTTHVDDRAWYRELIKRSKASANQGMRLTIVSGLRFPSDGEVIREEGGKIIKVYRPGAPEADLTDPTERERESIKHDSLLVNNGSLSDLQVCAAEMYMDLRNNDLQPEYHCSSQ